MKTIMIKTIKIQLILIAVIFSQQLIEAQTTDSVYTLRSCIKIGLENNAKLKQAQTETLKSRFQYKEAAGAGLPQITGFGTLEDYFEIPVTMVPGEIFGQPGTTIPAKLGTKYNSSVGIEAGQLIYNQTYLNTLKLLKKSCEISDLTLQKGKEELAYNIAQIYFIIQLSDLQLNLLDSTLLAFRQISNHTKQQLASGLILKTDFDRVSVSIGNLEAERENLLSMRNQQMNMLKYILGMDINRPLKLSKTTDILDELLINNDTLFNNQTEMKILEQKKELANLNIELTRSSNFPSLMAYASFLYMAQSDKFDIFDSKDNWYKTSFIGLKLTIPIFKGNQTKNKIQQNKIEFEQVEIAREDLKNELNTNYTNALHKLKSNTTVADRLSDNMILAHNVFNITNEQYKQGLKSLTDLLSAQSEYNTARSSWLQALFQTRLSKLELLKINGEINQLFPN